MALESKQEKSQANVDPLVANKDSPYPTSVEKHQSLVENESPSKTIRNNVEKETSWANQVD